ncbi:hypothetical protein [Cognatishimia maritima]|uniref:Uncharacterized protein n=1 Tax=Cognatishimia maritima TaxID=870908 RepID=A0A1M5JWL0_9RHOB|nr:hypothetical protein [Cognatishimia maritima]SHG44393.1 hypothetical protein SAMN04488044_0791 [Cognatishimia maritima]
MAFLNTFGRIAGLSLEKGVTVREILEVQRQRRALAQLDAQRLQDIRLTEGDVTKELARSIFDIPSTCRK